MRSLYFLAACLLAGAVACNSQGAGGGGGSGGPVADAGTSTPVPDAGAASGGGGSDAGAGGGGGSADAGAGGGGGGTGGGGGSDGGTAVNDCDGLMPGPLPILVVYATSYSSASDPSFCGLPIGDGTGIVAFQTFSTGHPSWTLLDANGQHHGSFGFWHGDAYPDAVGFIGYGGSSAEQVVAVDAFDTSGNAAGYSQVHGSGIFARDPDGGMLAAGHIANASGGPVPANQIVIMFNANGSVRYGPVALGTEAAIYGLGVDRSGSALIIVDGGSGTISAIWFDASGHALTGIFPIAASFEAGVSTWFETSTLMDGSLAVRRVDAPVNSATEERRTSQWLAVVPSGVARADPVPAWLASRPNVRLELARAGRAYATLPWATDVASCGQQVEIISPSGNSCGTVNFSLDGNSCRTRDLRLGLDGTVMQMLPADRESSPPGSPVRTCTVRYWPSALR